MKRTRVVITGIGVISPLGNSVQTYWEGLLAGRSGIRRITQFDPTGIPCKIAGEVDEFNPHLYMNKKEARRLPRSAQFALAAASQAVKDAGLPDTMPDPERSGVVFGTGLGGLDQLVEGIEIWKERGLNRLNPFTLPSGLPNMPAFLLARRFQCLGPNNTISTACATSTQTIGEGTEIIRRGTADLVLAGGTEALIRDYSFAGFCAMRAMPVNFNDSPQKASRPFDADREGFILSEGAGVLVLEKLEHALNRGARIYAEVVGHASSADGYHMAALDPSASGPIRAMKWALQDACIEPQQVNYINPHGTSTPTNDSNETKAIKAVFGEEAYDIPISSTKSMIGHAMGASGALEAIACIMSIQHNQLHPTINYQKYDPECDLDYVPNQSRPHQVKVAMSNSFGLGGQNAVIVLKKFVNGKT